MWNHKNLNENFVDPQTLRKNIVEPQICVLDKFGLPPARRGEPWVLALVRELSCAVHGLVHCFGRRLFEAWWKASGFEAWWMAAVLKALWMDDHGLALQLFPRATACMKASIKCTACVAWHGMAWHGMNMHGLSSSNPPCHG